MAIVMKHNTNPVATWKMGINHMSDMTDEEYNALLGHKTVTEGQAMMKGAAHKMTSKGNWPASVDWRQKGATTPVKDQGGCGSCWAFSAAAAIESAWYIATGKLNQVSEQQIASCSPNPLHCGGTGGCHGGTAWIAFHGVMMSGGVESQYTYPYISYFNKDYDCAFNLTESEIAAKPIAKLSSFVRLPQNDYASLMDAIANVGPVSISVDATNFRHYETGVFTDDGDEMTINHAVTLEGYGTENGQDYWLVRNSWSTSFGENGYIRLYRQGADAKCVVDTKPEDGYSCLPYPTNITACGTSGILSDSVYPVV